MVELPELGDDFHEMWSELFWLRLNAPAPWVLIGAQMVALHGWLRGREAIRPSQDADLLVNVRTVTSGTELMGQTLVERGYEFELPNPEGVGHRFRAGATSLDVLGPDGLGERASLRTISGAHTVEVPGGSQALSRATDADVTSRDMTGIIPLPNLLGAILVKIRAIAVDDSPAAQRRDVAFLLSLVEEPDPLVAEMRPSERSWLKKHPYLSDSSNESYRGIENAEDAAIVFRRLSGTS